MKNFDEFKNYVSINGQEIHSSIHKKVLETTNRQNFNDIGEEHEFYRRAWIEIGIMEMLEHYHNWLNGKS